jgi:hypothetical protein
MLNQKKSKQVFIILGISILLSIQSTGAFAKKPFGLHLNKFFRGSIRPHKNKTVFLPKSAKIISFGGENYFYHEGIFYKKALSGYLVVSAPIGAFILSLPIGYKTVIVNETPYYVYNDTYYVKEGKRFVVIDEIPSKTAVVSVPKKEVETPKNSFVVNIPNSNGSYTPVTIKKSAEGFVGPQGEYYTKFPNVEQLKVMYGK